jgi:hypothetical protein
MLRASILAGCVLSIVFIGFAGCMKSEALSEATGSVPASAAADSTTLAAEEGISASPAFFRFGRGGAAAAPPSLNHKIIYTATIDLVVEDFAGVPDKLIALVKQFDGYIADSNLTGATGHSRRGTWKVRVPVERFESFVNSAKGLGELISAGTNSQDVSEEFYDVEARLRNKTKEEERLLKLLEDRPGKLEDVIAIERELSRVREEIERMQGRLRVLTDLTTLTTVTLTINEIKNYEPPQTATLTTRLRRSFGGS